MLLAAENKTPEIRTQAARAGSSLGQDKAL